MFFTDVTILFYSITTLGILNWSVRNVTYVFFMKNEVGDPRIYARSNVYYLYRVEMSGKYNCTSSSPLYATLLFMNCHKPDSRVDSVPDIILTLCLTSLHNLFHIIIFFCQFFAYYYLIINIKV